MTKFLCSYGITIFIINTIFFAGVLPTFVSNSIFYTLLAIYALIIFFFFEKYISISINKPFVVFLLMNIFNFAHLVIFDRNLGSSIYFLAKITIFYMICLALVYNYDYYKEKFFQHLIKIGIFLLFLSIVLNPSISSNYQGIFGNRNEFGLFLTTIFGIYYITTDKFVIKDYLILSIFIFVILMSGSRNALVGVVLAIFVKNGIDRRLILYIFLLIAIFFILDYLNINTSINRLIEDKDTFHDRRWEFYYSLETFKNKMISGYGLDHYAYIDPKVVPMELIKLGHIINAHNSYLAALTQYGLLFSILVFSLILINFIYISTKVLFNKVLKKDTSTKVYYFILIFTMFSSIFESHMFGVNAFHGIMFWFSLGFLNYKFFYNIQDNK